MTNKKKIMGILNVTPDSYFEKGHYFEPKKAIEKALKLIEDGADIVDIGGCATNPFCSTPITIEEEIKRVIPVIQGIRKQTNLSVLSIDTYRPEVAIRALDCGVTFLNDISGFRNPKMLNLAKEYNASICIMHMQNMPETMQIKPYYPNGIFNEISHFLKTQSKKALEVGIAKEKIYLDPGFCFGKSLDDNFEILHNLTMFRELNFPLLVGLSRKSFLYKLLNTTPENALPATIAMNTYMYPYVDVFRVHDVWEHAQAFKMLELVNKKASLAKL